MNTAVTTATPGLNGVLAWAQRTFLGRADAPRIPNTSSIAESGAGSLPPAAEGSAAVIGAVGSPDISPPKKPVVPTGETGNRISSRRLPRNFEPGDLTQLAALSAMLRIEDRTTLVTEGLLIALLSSPSAAESYARELARRLALVETERKVDTVVGLGVNMLFANAIARALESSYQEQGFQRPVSVLPVAVDGGEYKLSYAATKDFVGGSRYIILAMPVVTSQSWREVMAIDSLIKSHQTTPSGIARLATVIQYETPPAEGEPERSKRLPVTRLMKLSFE